MSIVIMKPPPGVWFTLRPTRRNVLPLFLSAQRCQIEQRESRSYVLDAATIEEIGPIHSPIALDEDVQAEELLDIEIYGKTVIRQGIERNVTPSHAFPQPFDAVHRSGGDKGQRRVARRKMCRMHDRIGKH